MVSEELDLDGPYMNVTGTARAAMRIKLSDVWNVGLGESGLPPQLWPFVEAGAVYSETAPTKGSWLAGQTVHRRWGDKARNNSDGEQPRGWVCEESGTPGRWMPLGGGGA